MVPVSHGSRTQLSLNLLTLEIPAVCTIVHIPPSIQKLLKKIFPPPIENFCNPHQSVCLHFAEGFSPNNLLLLFL